ncbi:UNVERIFIED_ORG: crotonobetainyl-CoA:carnitine CoA-transferase CaiB-like acyl-CoA transferase [Ensifer adhaerens]|nr:crotonobetainyl-CoA:carnitine CoA-transferase CaiB-like acyl-CoA transferase [Ensifer adhaerens]
MSITGEPDTAGGSPVKTGVGIADVMCGMYATVGILAALRHRDRTGQGQQIDLALYDSQIAWLINAATNHLVSGRVPGRIGNAHPAVAVGAGLAKSRDRAPDQIGLDGCQILIGKAAARQIARLVIFDDDIGNPRQATHEVDAFRRGDVDCDRLR